MQDHLVRHQFLLHQVQHQQVRHFADDDASFLETVRAHQHLPAGKTVRRGPVGLDCRDGAGLPAPGVVDEEFRIDTEKPVQDFLSLQGAPRHVAHRVHPVRLQPGGDAPADPPEVRQGPVRPVFLPIGHFVQLGDPDAVLVGRRVLRLDVHRYLRQIQVRGDARRRGDMGGVQHVLDHPPRQFMGGKAVQGQVIGRVDEDLVDGIDMDVLGGNVLEIDLVDLRAHFHVQGHPRDGDLEAQGQVRILPDFRIVGGFAGEPCLPGPGGIDLPDLLLYLEEPSPPGDAVGFERRGYGEADGFVRPGSIGHHEVRR